MKNNYSGDACSSPLFWMREEANEEYQAMSQTIYVLGKKL